jgi:hypothetical protein
MSVLNSALTGAVSKCFPEIQLTAGASFLPMLDLEKGELSSSAAIEIARQTRSNAAVIAKRLLDEVVPVCGGEWRVDAGYMVLVRIPDALVREEASGSCELFSKRGAQGAHVREIVGLVPDVTTPAYARLRLIACVALQTLLTICQEKRVRVGFEPGPLETVDTFDGVVGLVRDAAYRVVANEAEVRREIVSREWGAGGGSPCTVWTSHHYFDRLSKNALAALNGAREEGRISIRMPNDGWLLARDRVLSDLIALPYLKKVIDRLSTTALWLRWIFHAASPIPSGDFDSAVALYDEGASPLWSVQALLARFERVVGNVSPKAELPQLSVIAAPWRSLVLRGVFLPVWGARAVYEGEISAWSQVLRDFSGQGHALLNSPESRRVLAAGDATENLRQIVASVEFGLSSILRLVATEGGWQR